MSFQTTPLLSLGPISTLFRTIVSKVGNTGLRNITGAPLSSSPKQITKIIKPSIGIPKVSAGTKATIGTVAASGAIFAATGGPEITRNATELGIAGLQSANDVTRFFSSNPLLLLALIGLGIVLVVKK